MERSLAKSPSVNWTVGLSFATILASMAVFLAFMCVEAFINGHSPYVVAFFVQTMVAVTGVLLVIRSASRFELFEQDRSGALLWYLVTLLASFLFLMGVVSVFGPLPVS